MARRATLRASDADRERIAERLRQATAEGRLLAEELEQRLGEAFSARTYGQLDALVADLPGDRVERRRKRPLLAWAAPAVLFALAVPVLLAVLTAVAFVLTSVLGIWILWVALGWWLFGGHGRGPARGRYHCRSSWQHRCGRWSGGPPSTRPGSWI